jgi:hypothetical protein
MGDPEGGKTMRLRSISGSVAALALLGMLAGGCSYKKDAEAAATRAENAARRAEAAASRVEAAAGRVEAAAARAEAAAEKAESMFSRHLRK